jgi:hypothetical protein
VRTVSFDVSKKAEERPTKDGKGKKTVVVKPKDRPTSPIPERLA